MLVFVSIQSSSLSAVKSCYFNREKSGKIDSCSLNESSKGSIHVDLERGLLDTILMLVIVIVMAIESRSKLLRSGCRTRPRATDDSHQPSHRSLPSQIACLFLCGDRQVALSSARRELVQGPAAGPVGQWEPHRQQPRQCAQWLTGRRSVATTTRRRQLELVDDRSRACSVAQSRRCCPCAPCAPAFTILLTMSTRYSQAQIVFLISTLSDDNFAKNRDEIRSVSHTKRQHDVDDARSSRFVTCSLSIFTGRRRNSIFFDAC